MNVQILIDGVVRQSAKLVARLATSGGARASLAHVGNHLFLELSSELEAQGVSRKVSADMFGMALRAYQRKLHRLRESATDRGQSPWESVYAFVRESGVVTRAQVLARFHRDDDVLVRGVLHDLAESRLLFTSGAGQDVIYRAVSEDDVDALRGSDGGLDDFLWAIVFREGPLTRDALRARLSTDALSLGAALERLETEGRLREVGGGEPGAFSAARFSVPLGDGRGWEAAVFDHLHAVVHTVCRKLDLGPASAPDDTVGGSTYTLEIWDGHPHAERVVGTLARFRAEDGGASKRRAGGQPERRHASGPKAGGPLCRPERERERSG